MDGEKKRRMKMAGENKFSIHSFIECGRNARERIEERKGRRMRLKLILCGLFST